MPHANGTTNGLAKRGANQQVLNGAVGAKKNAKGDVKTDYTRWRLKDDRGCQTWHYLESEEEIKAWPQSTADKYFLGMDTVS
jgi:lanosterol synthase